MDSNQNEVKENAVQPTGSFASTSVQSNQLSSFDGDDSAGGSRFVNHQWRIGTPWFKGANKPQHSDHTITGRLGDSSNHEEQRYYGGLMKSDSESLSKPSIGSTSRKHSKKGKGTHLIILPCDEDSLADFDESEWTPQDSSYGAACPVCGCIPKQVRRLIEFTLIAGMVVGFLWLLIATSIHVTNARKVTTQTNVTDHRNSNAMNIVDDDYYLENRNDDLAMLDDDVYTYNVVDDDDDTYGDDDQYFTDDLTR